MIWIALVGLSFANETCERTPTEQAATSAELKEIHRVAKGEGSRASADSNSRRLSQVRTIHDLGQVCTERDAYHAAGVLWTGDVLDVDIAWTLIQRATAAEVDGSSWLSLTIEDRHSVNHGQPQRWGTARGSVGSQRCLYPIDPSVTDEQRRTQRLKSLDQTFAAVLTANGIDDAPVTADELTARNLWCPPLDHKALASSLPRLQEPGSVTGTQTRSDFPVGELYGVGAQGWTGNAYTTGKGDFALHPLMRSSWGVTDRLDVKMSFVGLIGGPNASIEVAPIQNKDVALSFEVHAATGWFPGFYEARGITHFSAYAGPGMVNLSVAAGVTSAFDGNRTLTQPILRPEVGYDFHLSDKSVLTTTARFGVIQVAQGQPDVSGSVFYTLALHDVGISLGVVATYFDPIVLDLITNTPPIDLDAGFYPLPAAQIWGRF